MVRFFNAFLLLSVIFTSSKFLVSAIEAEEDLERERNALHELEDFLEIKALDQLLDNFEARFNPNNREMMEEKGTLEEIQEVKKFYNEPSCSEYDHPVYGSGGQCMPTSNCPGGKYVSNLCPTQASDIKCCFTGGEQHQNIAGPVPNDCLRCICTVESGCQIPKPLCHMDVSSSSCGPYQIKQAYWEDARQNGGDLDGDWQKCSATFDCSERAVQGYMMRYAVSSRLDRSPKCEDFARIHNGGPNGFKNSNTQLYWGKVQACLESK